MMNMATEMMAQKLTPLCNFMAWNMQLENDCAVCLTFETNRMEQPIHL